MSGARHTPGPWTVGYRAIDVGCENAKAGGYAKLFDVRGWGYLTGHGHGGLGLDAESAYAIQQANARLIAAAPELLAVAHEAFDFLGGVDDAGAIRAKLIDAIAKAEGRTDA